RVDDDRLAHMRRSPGKTRQNQDARVQRLLRGDVFLGDQVHAIAQWRHQADRGGAVEARKSVSREAARHVAQWHPVELGELAVDLARLPVEIALQRLIFADIAARAWRDLK